MRRDLVVDGLIAAVVAALVIVLTPGIAVAGAVAIIVLVVCGVTLLAGALRRRRLAHPVARHARPGRRPPPSRRGRR